MKHYGKKARRRLTAAAACAVILFLSARPADPGTALVFEDLNFAFVLPEMMRGHTEIARSERNFGGEKVTAVTVAYAAESLSANVFVFEEMSEAFFETRRKGEPPSPVCVWKSDSGRVVVLNGLQSNPFPEESREFELFLGFPSQMPAVLESFRFLNGAAP